MVAKTLAQLTTCIIFICHVTASVEDLTIRQVTDDELLPNLLGTHTESKFRVFISDYGKSYSTMEEYVHRLGIFARNVLKAAEHQIMDPTAVHGVTQFSDLTEEEFKRMYTGVADVGGGRGGTVGAEAPMVEVEELPKDFDWREKGMELLRSRIKVHVDRAGLLAQQEQLKKPISSPPGSSSVLANNNLLIVIKCAIQRTRKRATMDVVGEDGYYKLCRGYNMCGINSMVSAVATQVSF